MQRPKTGGGRHGSILAAVCGRIALATSSWSVLADADANVCCLLGSASNLIPRTETSGDELAALFNGCGSRRRRAGGVTSILTARNWELGSCSRCRTAKRVPTGNDVTHVIWNPFISLDRSVWWTGRPSILAMGPPTTRRPVPFPFDTAFRLNHRPSSSIRKTDAVLDFNANPRGGGGDRFQGYSRRLGIGNGCTCAFPRRSASWTGTDAPTTVRIAGGGGAEAERCEIRIVSDPRPGLFGPGSRWGGSRDMII